MTRARQPVPRWNALSSTRWVGAAVPQNAHAFRYEASPMGTSGSTREGGGIAFGRGESRRAGVSSVSVVRAGGTPALRRSSRAFAGET